VQGSDRVAVSRRRAHNRSLPFPPLHPDVPPARVWEDACCPTPVQPPTLCSSTCLPLPALLLQSASSSPPPGAHQVQGGPRQPLHQQVPRQPGVTLHCCPAGAQDEVGRQAQVAACAWTPNVVVGTSGGGGRWVSWCRRSQPQPCSGAETKHRLREAVPQGVQGLWWTRKVQRQQQFSLTELPRRWRVRGCSGCRQW
jgi:hypothetical protein